MEEQTIQPQELYYPAADTLKFWLMPFVCVACFGFPSRYGSLVSALCGFAPLCFYILCGFFAFSGDAGDERLRFKRGAGRSGLMFLIMALVCFSVNAAFYLLRGVSVSELLGGLLRRRVVFNFVVLSAWPFQMGDSISFIQSLFYAYVLLFLASGLFHSGKARLAVMLACFAVALLTGELAGLLPFRILGYACLPQNVVSCALPYLLLGGLLREKREAMQERPAILWVLMVPLGLALTCGEFWLLNALGLLVTTAQSVGLGVAAFGLCAFVLCECETVGQSLPYDEPPAISFFAVSGRYFARNIYLISQPVAFLLLVPASFFLPRLAYAVQTLGGLVIYAVCFVAVFLVNAIVSSVVNGEV